jgi:hypothetical protein
MNIDIDYGFIYYTANVNVVGMYWRTFGGGFWYNIKEEDRKIARRRLKEEVWEDIYDEYPALIGSDVKFTESEGFNFEPPVIQYQIPKKSRDMEMVNTESPNQDNKQPTLEEQIRSVTSPAVLKAVYEKIVKGKPEQEVYNQQLKKLSK